MWVGAGVDDWIRGVKGLGKIQFYKNIVNLTEV